MFASLALLLTRFLILNADIKMYDSQSTYCATNYAIIVLWRAFSIANAENPINSYRISLLATIEVAAIRNCGSASTFLI